MTGLSAVREKLERGLKRASPENARDAATAHDILVIAISEALALMENEPGELPTWREACFDDTCEGCCTALENRLRFVERDHEAMEKLRGMSEDLPGTFGWRLSKMGSLMRAHTSVAKTDADPTDAILGTEGENGEDDGE